MYTHHYLHLDHIIQIVGTKKIIANNRIVMVLMLIGVRLTNLTKNGGGQFLRLHTFRRPCDPDEKA